PRSRRRRLTGKRKSGAEKLLTSMRMRGSVVRLAAILLVAAWLTLAGGCARPPATGITSIKATSQGELRSYLLDHKADVDQFRMRGPFTITARENLELTLAT